MTRFLRRTSLMAVPLLLHIATAPPPLQGQGTGIIRGRVATEGANRAVTAAQVVVDGTAVSGVTNDAGEYRLAGVPAGSRTVRVRRLGYNPTSGEVTVVAGETATLDFSLREAPIALDEVVVTATGEQRRKEIANSTATIPAARLADIPVTNTQQLLSAQSPGITVLANSGQPGAGGVIRLRGNNSISQGNNPIIYVDGVRIYSGTGAIVPNARQTINPFNDIKPEDIDRVEIVKGAAATTLYGTEASGGVIQIFTKRGRSGAPRWTLGITEGTNDLSSIGPKGDPSGIWLKSCRGPYMNGVDIVSTSPTFGQEVLFEDSSCPASGKWIRTGLVQRYSGSVAGGSDVMQYYFAGTYNDEEGAIPTSRNKNGGFRGNFGFAPWRGLDLSLNTSYTKGRLQWVPDGNLANGFLLNVGRGPSGNYSASNCSPTVTICKANGEALNIPTFTRTDHFITGLTLNFSPVQAWTNRLTIGYDYNNNENRSLIPFGHVRLPTGQLTQGDWNRKFLSIDYASTIKKSLGTSLNTDLSFGGQLFQDDLFSKTTTGTNLVGPGDPTLLSAATRTVGADTRRRVVNAGLFTQAQVAWKDRAFVTAGLRVDGNSAFGKDFGLQAYPKVGVSYVLSDHAFWPSNTWETFKLRAALGESGKAPGAFDAVRTWAPIAGDNAKPGFTPDQLGNDSLGPERTREFEFGFESSAFGGRLSIDATRFDTRTLDALIQVRYPPSEGFLSRQLENIGEIHNQGWEIHAEGGVLRTPNVDWRLRLNYTKIQSKAVDLGDVSTISIGSSTEVREGVPVPSLFGRKITNPDEFADPILTDTTVYIGPTFPPTVIGTGTTLELLGRLTLDALGEFQRGAYNINFIGYQNGNRGAWRPCYDIQKKLIAAIQGDPTAIADVTARDRARCAVDRTVQSSDFFIESADFFRLRYVTLTYQLPPSLVPGAKSATVTLAGRNLLLRTDYSGLDPESADQADNTFARREYYQLPTMRSFTIELKLNW